MIVDNDVLQQLLDRVAALERQVAQIQERRASATELRPVAKVVGKAAGTRPTTVSVLMMREE